MFNSRVSEHMLTNSEQRKAGGANCSVLFVGCEDEHLQRQRERGYYVLSGSIWQGIKSDVDFVQLPVAM